MTTPAPTPKKRMSTVRKAMLGLIIGTFLLANFIIASVVTPDVVRDTLNTVAELGLYFVALPAGALFLGLFMGLSDWRSTLPGRAVGSVGLALVGVLIVNAATLVLGTEYFGREYVRILAYWGIGFAMLYLCYSVWHFLRLGLLERRGQSKKPSLTDDREDVDVV
jgi:hypothetical protein